MKCNVKGTNIQSNKKKKQNERKTSTQRKNMNSIWIQMFYIFFIFDMWKMNIKKKNPLRFEEESIMT